MGLCKCPKKKVTNLFCFEHRVNVCEHCLVSNHPSCIVQSYLKWLQDSDYSPNCTLCNEALSQGEVVRLLCLDVFHWHCLDRYAQQLPSHTAPAGYTCPSCKSQLFPASNQVSPIAESLRTVLSKVNWARAGLGLPLIEDPPPGYEEKSAYELNLQHQAELADTSGINPASSHTPVNRNFVENSIVNMGSTDSAHSRLISESASIGGSVPRRLFDSRLEDDFVSAPKSIRDHDDDKYKRRSAVEWLGRWFSSRTGVKSRDHKSAQKRYVMLAMLGVFTLFTLIVLFIKLGRNAADNDPFLDPMSNPNIRVAEADKLS